MLAHKDNGDCVYLGPTGCTIQHVKPQQCYEMDCRRIVVGARSKSRLARLVDQGALSPEVVERGRELLKLHGPAP